MSTEEKIEIENVNTPGVISKVNKAKHMEMKAAFLKVLPKTSPGIYQKEVLEKVKPLLSDMLFPEGKTSAWWVKTVQLDLEAKGIVIRENTKPLR